MSKIIVRANPETNEVLTPNPNKAGWSTTRVEQSTPTMSGRIVNIQKRVAFITGETANMEALGLTNGGEFPIPGRLVVKESLTPFYEGQSPKIVPNTNDLVCTLGGAPIYREVTFSSDTTVQDVFVAHDNIDEIRAAQEEVKAEAGQLQA